MHDTPGPMYGRRHDYLVAVCSMQTSGRQQRVKASTSNISLGDNRIPTFATSYGRDFHAPFESSIRRRAINANARLTPCDAGRKPAPQCLCRR